LDINNKELEGLREDAKRQLQAKDKSYQSIIERVKDKFQAKASKVKMMQVNIDLSMQI
jgi:hypothetical protein